MSVIDLKKMCCLCAGQLDDSYINGSLAEYSELRESIKSIYKIDISATTETSTSVCLKCCDEVIRNTVGYQRLVGGHEILQRADRMRRSIKKRKKAGASVADKTKKSEEPTTAPATDEDVEMAEIGAQNAPAAPANFFGNLTSFHQSPQIGQPSVGSTQLPFIVPLVANTPPAPPPDVVSFQHYQLPYFGQTNVNYQPNTISNVNTFNLPNIAQPIPPFQRCQPNTVSNVNLFNWASGPAARTDPDFFENSTSFQTLRRQL